MDQKILAILVSGALVGRSFVQYERTGRVRCFFDIRKAVKSSMSQVTISGKGVGYDHNEEKYMEREFSATISVKDLADLIRYGRVKVSMESSGEWFVIR